MVTQRNSPPFGWVQVTSCGKIFVQGVQHGVTPLAINLADQLDVLVEEAITRDFVGDVLIEGRGVQIGSLLQHARAC